MASEPDHLGNRIEQLLWINPVNDSNGPAEERQQADLRRLQNLSVETTSGDTLVIVQFPTGHFVDCDGRKWETKEFLMDSEKLRATGSSVFAEKLSPEAQAQVRRRLDRDAKPHIHTRYVLDLTPPSEGDELASLVVDLSLSYGTRDWWWSHIALRISKFLVSGHDDVCPQHIDVFASDMRAGSSRRGFSDVMIRGDLDYPETRKIEDYCPIRHRAAIIRLLMAISYGDLVLNSAPRMITMAMVAKSLDCVGVVKDHVLSWLLAEPNQNFIDVNTEDALNIAWVYELRAVARVAFRVLVVERAIENPGRDIAGNTESRQTIFGRPRGSINEEPETCIQHAAQKLRQRAEDLLARLKSDDINTFLGIKRWPEHDPELCRRLRAHMHDVAVDSLAKNDAYQVDLAGFTRYRARYVSAADLVPLRDTYPGLSHAQRILTPWFWSLFRTSAESRRPYFGAQAQLDLLAAGFDIEAFHTEFADAVLNLSAQWMYPDLEVSIVRTGPLIFALSDEEFKFLPLWAGGLDDGTGTVFQPDVPDAEHGFPIGPGPSFHTGETIPEDDEASSTVKGSDDAATAPTGAFTDSVTKGYSVNATAPSQMAAGIDHDAAEGSVLAAATAQLALTTSQQSAVQGDHLAAHLSTASPDNFDWTIDSDDEELSTIHYDLDFDDEPEDIDDT
ncbi:hypothetical protein F5Y14DRAFT_3995 [Nemania sp. NC0429]|nr:hypothetical protein F5Y14DRAFT_3995 [Nemania sp. NC0429]